ncbi:hypothetical protein RRG08_061324 [Elysia crispata]|uniref:Uncharacterized protein n=1 Tax=Elysia crispata TaxID=231223 RepID=A0AAE1DJH7_9GAST|nr:hypothetical protein RRG08_061324 [Elysia crispata]
MSNAYISYPYFSQSHAILETPESVRNFRVKFILVVSAGSLLGIIGNGLLLCFYGNRETRAYRSRDAIYIRRMAYTDFAVCCLVIPYAVLFEAGLIRSDFTCKTMEFSRHFLIYMSHLLLYTYCWELPQRHLYTDSQTYNVNTSLFSIFVSLLGAAPTLFIFEVISHSGNQTVGRGSGSPLFSGESCHLTINIVNDPPVYESQGFTLIYFLIPVVMYSVCLYWFIANLIGYLQYKAMYSKNSIFLTKLEDVHLFKTVSSSEVIDYESQVDGPKPEWSVPNVQPVLAHENQHVNKNQNPFRNSMAGFGFITTSFGGKQELLAVPSYRVSYSDKQENYIGFIREHAGSLSSGSSSSSGGSFCSVRRDTIGSRARNDGNNNSSSKPDKIARFESDVSVFEINLPERQKIRERRGTGYFPREEDSISQENNSSDSGESEGNGTNFQRVSVKETEPAKTKSDKSIYRSILTKKQQFGGRPYPRVSSYKKSMAILIVMDLFIIAMVMFVYILLGTNSAVLNLVHLKSIISFYVLSYINNSLRRCVWGKDGCMYFESYTEQPRPKSSSVRPSVMQVRFVKERLRKKHEKRVLRHLARRARGVEGTEIDA